MIDNRQIKTGAARFVDVTKGTAPVSLPTTSRWLLVDGDRLGSGSDSVRDHFQRRSAGGNRRRNVEWRRNFRRPGLYARDPIVRIAIHNCAGRVGDAHDREVGVALVVVAVNAALAHASELRSGDEVVGGAVRHRALHKSDGRSATGARAA